MSVATLCFAPWTTKRQLTPTKYTSLTSSVAKILFHTVFLPDDSLDISWARKFVGTYAQDSARHALQRPGNDEPITETKLSSLELSVRALTLQLAGRLARLQGGLDVTVLVDLAVAYGAANTTALRTLFKDAFHNTPVLIDAFNTEVLPAFASNLEKQTSPTSIYNIAYILLLLFHSAPQIVALAVDQGEVIPALARAYQAGLENLASSRGGINLDSPEAWHKDWLHAKIGLLDLFHEIIQTLLQSNTSKDSDRVFEMLFAILGLPSTSHATSSIPFVSQPLLSDYQYTFNLSSVLTEKFRNNDDPRVDLFCASLDQSAPTSQHEKPAGALSVLLKDRSRVRSGVPNSESKGKAKDKATSPGQEPKDEAALDLAVSQVLDILPDYTPRHIRRCLQHPTFDGNPEKLIAAFLEGTVPVELIEDRNDDDVSIDIIPREEQFQFIKDRRNVWDDVAMDFSKLTIGKSKNDADTLLEDRSFIEQMKADIIRRAEELSDDDDVTEKSPEKIVAFEEELDDSESLVDKGVKITGDGEESEDMGAEDGDDNATGPQVETILELAYIADPKAFERDGATRRSKSRAELKAKTGWGDEQIEGWRIMLERNPKKDKILQKHEFAGNTPLATDIHTDGAGPSSSSRSEPGRPVRGGRGRGRGRGRGQSTGEGDSSDAARSRAWKDKNKSRTANHNRKRGHDKKMARGGGGGPP